MQSDRKNAELAKRTAKGAGWSVLMRFAARMIGLVNTIILARLLVPHDFGLLALATMLLTFLQKMSEFNFSAYLVREQSVDRSHYDTAWTLGIVRSVVIALLLIAGAPVAAEFFHEPRLIHIIDAIAGMSAIGGLTNVGIVDFQKALAFHKDFQFNLCIRLTSFVVTVTLAFLWRDYRALVGGMLGASVIRLILSYAMHPFRPRLSFVRTADIFRFSKWLLARGVLSFVDQRGDIIVIGRLFDAASLGLYSIAYEIASLATTEIIGPIQRALFAGLSTLSSEPEPMKRAFVQAQAVIVLLVLPVASGIGLSAELLVRLTLGEKWLGAVPLIQILTIAGIARVSRANTSPFMLAAGLPRLTAVQPFIGVVIGFPLLIYAASNWGMIGAAWAISAAAVLKTVVNYLILSRTFGIAVTRILSAMWRPVVACLVMSLVVWKLSSILPASGGFSALFLSLVAIACSGATIYAAVTMTLWRLCDAPDGAERHALTALQSLAWKAPLNKVLGRA